MDIRVHEDDAGGWWAEDLDDREAPEWLIVHRPGHASDALMVIEVGHDVRESRVLAVECMTPETAVIEAWLSENLTALSGVR